MAARVLLAFEALVWLPYGIYCFFVPSYLEQIGGVAFVSPTGSTELRAMYGGLQIALGALSLAGALRESMTQPALLTLAFLGTGLGSTRLLGVLIDGGLSGYTVAGLFFEFLTAALAIRLLRRRPPPAPTLLTSHRAEQDAVLGRGDEAHALVDRAPHRRRLQVGEGGAAAEAFADGGPGDGLGVAVAALRRHRCPTQPMPATPCVT